MCIRDSASDEWYLLAGEELPEEERYDGYLQLENGVGMLRLLKQEFDQAYEALPGDEKGRKVTIATGRLAGPYIRKLTERLREKYPRTEVEVCSIRNDFFGESKMWIRDSLQSSPGSVHHVDTAVFIISCDH